MIKKRIKQLCKELAKDDKVLNDLATAYIIIDILCKQKAGYAAQGLSQWFKIPLYRVRKTLRELRKNGIIERYARWYGRNEGYCFIYKMSDKFKGSN